MSFKDKLRENTYISGLLTTVVFNTKTGEVENKILDLNGLVKKQIMTLKYQILKQNNLLLLIMISFQVKYLEQKEKK